MLSLLLARKLRRRSGLLSLISIISTLSIAIGIAALIIGLSAMNGFETELENRVLSVVPHGEFYVPGSDLSDWQAVQRQIDNHPNIVYSAPYITFTGLLENSNKIKTIQLQGIDLLQEQKMSSLPRYVLNNKWSSFKQDSKQIIIGFGLANALSAKEGDWITLLIPSSDGLGQLKQPKRVRLQVIGIMNLSGNLGHNVALIPLSDAQQYLQMGDNVTSIKVKVNDVYNASYLVNQVVMDIDRPIYVMSWEWRYGYMYRDIQMIRQIMYLAMIVVIGVACFSIVSTLVIAVKDKQRDIAILKTLGASNQLISATFVLYGVISGLIGSIIGIVLGVIISKELACIIKTVEKLIGHQLLNSSIYFIDFLPSEIKLTDIIMVFCTAMILTLMACYYPARQACKVDPVKILNSY